ncbi:cache domain-containing protein [Methylomonas sp. EFPC3]|uniref:cache domain-containing protein n=1 Tax=Methylomonas sp. EFPC3 TaxID=3021710 RepID=UPI002417A7A5|nr:cache domain-containing protein [Methylomonas sp. EFPC3]WFP50557.1 cache domain-containing protein [Methylomonas sp. EFPC3]
MNALIEKHTPKLLNAMVDVRNFETRLAQLNNWWGKITLIGKINSHNVAPTILDDMARTQNKFGELQRKLTRNLLVENLQKLVLDNASKAQVAIDLLVRNLFERTADVGFLATDDDIRVFLAQAEPEPEQVGFIENRLREYVKKYSVYDEIAIFDAQGRLRAHLDADNRIEDTDPLVAETLRSDSPYLETFRYSALQADRRRSLIYSCKITETDQKNSRVLGVLCLCFRFEDEMRGIFADLLAAGDRGIIAILDTERRVIASSNEQLLPVDTRFHRDDAIGLINFQGHDYIVNSLPGNGYQGYCGLGWRGQMMTRLDVAFGRETGGCGGADYSEIIGQSDSFPQELKEIRQASVDINADLGLLVLNGKIASARQNAAEFMPVLEAIKQVGTDIAGIFAASVNSLQEVTVMSSHLNNAGFLASLAVNIMDRNLYERANDCRWWALTSAFRRNLAKAEISAAEKRQMCEILAYINALYTVYTNLYLYDAHGDIVAVSDATQTSLIGSKVEEATGYRSVMGRVDSQHYGVSGFGPTRFYQGRHTYIYNAAVTDPTDNGRVVGGIGIVFDSEPQFSAMLREILPQEAGGAPLKNSFAVFTDRQGRILGLANHNHYRIGERLLLDDVHFALKNGQTSSSLLRHEGANYVLGVAAGKGYREFKTADAYRNDVLAFVFIPL